MDNVRSVLPAPLHGDLATLGAKLARGPAPRELRSVLDGLDKLPIKSIVPASIEIARALHPVRSMEIVPSPTGSPLPLSKLLGLLKPRSAISAYSLLENDPVIAWLFLFHSNGRVREAALNAIQTPPTSPFFFAAISWRLNDWAEPVRQAAVRCASRIFPVANSHVAAAASLYLLDRRFVWGRWTREQALLDLLFERPDVVGLVASMICDAITGSPATSLRYALRYPMMDQHLPRLAARAVQPAVRAVAFRCLINRRASWPIGFAWQWIDKVYNKRRRILEYSHREISAPPQADTIAAGLNDRSAMVKHVAIDAVMGDRKAIPNINEVIARLARDKSPSIRRRADFLARHPG